MSVIFKCFSKIKKLFSTFFHLISSLSMINYSHTIKSYFKNSKSSFITIEYKDSLCLTTLSKISSPYLVNRLEISIRISFDFREKMYIVDIPFMKIRKIQIKILCFLCVSFVFIIRNLIFSRLVPFKVSLKTSSWIFVLNLQDALFSYFIWTKSSFSLVVVFLICSISNHSTIDAYFCDSQMSVKSKPNFMMWVLLTTQSRNDVFLEIIYCPQIVFFKKDFLFFCCC